MTTQSRPEPRYNPICGYIGCRMVEWHEHDGYATRPESVGPELAALLASPDLFGWLRDRDPNLREFDDAYFERKAATLLAALRATNHQPVALDVEREALSNVLREMDSAKLEAESQGYHNMEWRTWPCDDIAEAIVQRLNPLAYLRDSQPARDERLFEAVRRVIVDGIDSPGTRNELHLAFYSVRDGKEYRAKDSQPARDRVLCRCGRSVLPENWDNHTQRQDGRRHTRATLREPLPDSQPARDGLECPMCGGEGRIYDITEAINAAQAEGVVLAPLRSAAPWPVEWRGHDHALVTGSGKPVSPVPGCSECAALVALPPAPLERPE